MTTQGPLHWRIVCAALVGLLSSASQAQPASMVLQCQVRYMSQTVSFDTLPTDQPYAVASHDIAERFRFKAVVVGTPSRVDHIALYAYDMSVPNAPVLVHEVVHKPPFALDRPVPGLSGWNHIYSSRLGREMVYGCALTNRPAP